MLVLEPEPLLDDDPPDEPDDELPDEPDELAGLLSLVLESPLLESLLLAAPSEFFVDADPPPARLSVR